MKKIFSQKGFGIKIIIDFVLLTVAVLCDLLIPYFYNLYHPERAGHGGMLTILVVALIVITALIFLIISAVVNRKK